MKTTIFPLVGLSRQPRIFISVDLPTLGLPIIRTSVDHGVAFGKAGKGTANEESLLNAIDYAILFAKNRKL